MLTLKSAGSITTTMKSGGVAIGIRAGMMAGAAGGGLPVVRIIIIRPRSIHIPIPTGRRS
jgi:hypothetical protein